MHSNKSTTAEIDEFMNEWKNRHPIVLVPTKYYGTPTSHFRNLGVNLIIWANHNLRSSIKAMQETSKRIFIDQSLHNVEKNVVSVSEVFRLQNVIELKHAEKKYLPNGNGNGNGHGK